MLLEVEVDLAEAFVYFTLSLDNLFKDYGVSRVF